MGYIHVRLSTVNGFRFYYALSQNITLKCNSHLVISYTIFQLVQPRSAIILVTVVDGTVEFSRTAFTPIQTVDGPDGGVGIGAGVGGTGGDCICEVLFVPVIVVFVEVMVALDDAGTTLVVVFVGECTIWAWFRFSCSFVHSPGAQRWSPQTLSLPNRAVRC